MDVSDAILIIGTKTVVTLLPLIPAYVLFATLKSQAAVAGPFSGLKIQLGGAFAAYFVVLMVLWQGLGSATDEFHYHSWKVMGTVKFDSNGNVPDFGQITSYVRPPDLPVRKDGTFQFEVPVKELSNGQLEWPQVSMEALGFEPGIFLLYEPSRKPTYGARLIPEEYDRLHRVISLKEPVVMHSKRESPYDAKLAQHPAVVSAVSQ